jgi:transketolase
MTGISQRDLANALRALAMDAVEQAKSGHPGMPMGMADVAAVLFGKFLTFDPADPAWPGRDRFVLSAGHGSMLLYALLHLSGYAAVSLDEIRRFRQLGARTAGHPEYGHCPGVETTTGPLGQGLATAVGMAIAERMMVARFGEELAGHRTYVIAGDGCLMEGISHEAIDLAGHLKLGRLIVLFDDNGISIDGATSLATSADQLRRFEACGWSVARVDGHDAAEVEAALAAAQLADRPTLIACRTTIGFGAPTKQGTAGVHGAPLGAAELAAAKQNLGWAHGPFEIPEPIRRAWAAIGARGASRHAEWKKTRAALDDATAKAWDDALAGARSPALAAALSALRQRFEADKPKIASRQASEIVIGEMTAAQGNIVGGSADLTHSNLTKGKQQKPVTAADFSGSYLHYGVREHAMGAMMNGIALHGGFIPYGGTFLVFADYARPSIRLAALMGIRAIYVLTHDSIGLGEDGPTHQPVEHMASLRAMPNVNVFRPADAIETLEAWQCALASESTPSLLCLSRQALAPLDRTGAPEAGVARGGYVLREANGARDVTLIATGSELGIALAAADLLAKEGRAAAVVSLPCWELFRAQPGAYRNRVLGGSPRVAVEAAARFGWDEWLGRDGAFVGMAGFGASAPAGDLYQHFGITAEAVAAAARALIST